MKSSWRRVALVSLIGTLVVGGACGLAIELAGSRSPTGSAVTVSFLLLAALGGGALVCLLLLVRLLGRSEKLMRANAELARQNRRIEDATEAKTRFVANMSHELRSPLNAVIGFAELMHDGRTGPVSRNQREYLGIIRASADHLLKLINEVLDLSKIEAGHMRLDPEAVEPATVVRECISSMSWLAADRRVRIEFEPAAVGPVSLDPARLRQVILNFLSNAIKFSPSGGRVLVKLARRDGRLVVSVSDEGPGIDPQDQARAFEEFVQVGDRSSPGSGLGLAVTRRIVESQGGEVTVDSRVGEGSTFTAWLPWIEADVAGGGSDAGPARDDQWERVVAELAPHAPPPGAGEETRDEPSGGGGRFGRGERRPSERRGRRAETRG
jgi:signal transduction histidine kinase